MNYLNLASGAAHFKSPEAALKKTMAALENNETFYGEISGLPALKQTISARYQTDYQVQLPEENILITAGTKQALFNLFSVLLKPGDEVILPEPSWFGFTEIFKLLQIETVFLETTLPENYDVNATKLEALITEKTRLFIYSNPGNPTGRVYAKSEIETWLDVLQKHPRIKILSDEIYDLLLYEPFKMPTLLQFPDPHGQHMVVNGFSKNFGMSGWRIGYLIAPEEILKQCIHFQQTTISGVNPFIQEGAVAALQTKEDYLPARLKELKSNRELLCNWLDQHPEINYFKPQAAYYVFADLNALLHSDKFRKAGLETTAKLCDHLKAALQLEFQPGEKFNFPGFIRITFAVPQAHLQEALNRLEQFFAQVGRS